MRKLVSFKNTGDTFLFCGTPIVWLRYDAQLTSERNSTLTLHKLSKYTTIKNSYRVSSDCYCHSILLAYLEASSKLLSIAIKAMNSHPRKLILVIFSRIPRGKKSFLVHWTSWNTQNNLDASRVHRFSLKIFSNSGLEQSKILHDVPLKQPILALWYKILHYSQKEESIVSNLIYFFRKTF